MNLITEISKLLSKYIMIDLKDQQDVTLTTIERRTKKALQVIGQHTAELLLSNLQTQYPDPEVGCKCGEQATYIRQRQIQVKTILGDLKIKRPYYLCSHCHKGQSPYDTEFGLKPNSLSHELSRLVAMAGVQLPFQTAGKLFEELTLVSVSDKTIAKATQKVGDCIIQQETEMKQRSENQAQLLKIQRENRPLTRLYGSMDGVKVHIRDDEEHRWRDLKVGAWFEAKAQPPTHSNGKWSIQAENITYYADICKASDFGPLFWAYGLQRRAQLARELIFIADGADWIWNLVSDFFPNAIQILDWFHASEHLMPVAQAIWPEKEKQLEWITAMKLLLWQGDCLAVIEELDRLALIHTADVLRTTANYFDNHQKRMRYDLFRKNGYQIGSGTIESAAKQIGLMRMKVPGAIWNESNAIKVSKARAAFLSDRWDSLPLVL